MHPDCHVPMGNKSNGKRLETCDRTFSQWTWNDVKMLMHKILKGLQAREHWHTWEYGLNNLKIMKQEGLTVSHHKK